MSILKKTLVFDGLGIPPPTPTKRTHQPQAYPHVPTPTPTAPCRKTTVSIKISVSLQWEHNFRTLFFVGSPTGGLREGGIVDLCYASKLSQDPRCSTVTVCCSCPLLFSYQSFRGSAGRAELLCAKCSRLSCSA